MNKEILSALLILVIIIGAGAGYLIGAGHQLTSTSISTTTAPGVTTTSFATTTLTTTSTAWVPSLQLFAMVSPNAAWFWQNISVIVGVYNPLPTSVVANASEIITQSQNPCGLGVSPIGIRVYEGHYTFGNLSEATALLLYNASGPPPPCPAPVVNSYTFLPNSDIATISGVGELVANETITFSGYWTPSLTAGSGNYYYQQHPPGEYTVVAFDAWGQQAIDYFFVSPGIP